jgi:hypothetical protein
MEANGFATRGIMHKLIVARRVHSELAALRKLAATRRAFVQRKRRLTAANLVVASLSHPVRSRHSTAILLGTSAPP